MDEVLVKLISNIEQIEKEIVKIKNEITFIKNILKSQNQEIKEVLYVRKDCCIIS
jgi:uncharacterized protein (UPF0335 family)